MTTNYLFNLTCVLLISNFTLAQQSLNSVPQILLEDMTLQKNTKYQIDHQVTISNKAILYIEEGVVLVSKDGNAVILIIDNGSKVVANGSFNAPITIGNDVKTKREPSIIMKSLESNLKQNNDTSGFTYLKINNPIVVANLNSFEPTEAADMIP